MNFDTTKVLYCGDSLVDDASQSWQMTWLDKGQDASNHWTALLSRMIDVAYVNTALGGDTLYNINQNLQTRIYDYNPSLVVMDGGWNDAMGSDTGASGYQVLTRAQFKALVKDTILDIISHGIQVVFVDIPIAYGTGCSTLCPQVPTIYSEVADEVKAVYPNDFFFVNLEGSILGSSGYNTGTSIEYSYRLSDKLHLNNGGWCKCAGLVYNALITEDTKLGQRKHGGGQFVSSPTMLTKQQELSIPSVVWEGVADGESATISLDLSNAENLVKDDTIKIENGLARLG